MQAAEPLARELLLLGGGHSHVILLRMLGMKPIPGLRVTLVSPDCGTPYSGMLPGRVAGHYEEAEMHIDLAPLCRFAGAAFVQAEAIGLDAAAQEVQCRGRPPLRYDVLSIDIGIRPKVPPGLTCPQVIAVKPIGGFLRRWQEFLQSEALTKDKPLSLQKTSAGAALPVADPKGKPLNLGEAGAGAGSAELPLAGPKGKPLNQGGIEAGAGGAELPLSGSSGKPLNLGGIEAGAGGAELPLAGPSGKPLNLGGTEAGAGGAELPLAGASGKPLNLGVIGAGAGGVELLLAIRQALGAKGLADCHALHLFADGPAILPAIGASVRRRFERLLHDRGISVHRDFSAQRLEGGVLTAASGAAVPLDLAFLVTDAAPHGWLADTALAKDPDGFIQVNDRLQSLSHPNIFAAGDCAAIERQPRPKAGVYAVRQGKPLYRNVMRHLLGRRLRRFKPQKRFLTLISTGDKAAVAARNGVSMQGAWVWRWKDWIDRRFMARFSDLPAMPAPPPGPLAAEFDQQMQCGGCGSKLGAGLLREALTEAGLGAPEDAAATEVPAGKTLLQSVDHFRAFTEDPYQFAHIALCHALSDIYACNGDPFEVQALITLPYAKPSIARGLLRQLMAGIRDALEEEGARLVGGHTSQGLELSLGFAVTGLAEPGKAWDKGGLGAGDALLLTKPLGTGTLFAADMQGRAKGAWVAAALAQMAQSSRAAMLALRQHRVSACTDVTGFGLAGHLSEMLAAGAVGARLDAAALPRLDGAAECFAQGIYSSLHASNAEAFPVKGNALPVLHDPQTAGGLLVGLPKPEASAALAALHQAGYAQATHIGDVIKEEGIALIS